MKIVICGSMSSCQKMIEVEKELLKNNHDVVLPENTKKYADKILNEENSHESTQNKIERNLIRSYFKKIKNSDAILIVNPEKNGVDNYIGGNSFLEMGFAHILNKTIFILNNIPEMIYSDEINAMQPIVLKGDLKNMHKLVK